jgi:DNA/RNA endonuclease G (NUC1)
LSQLVEEKVPVDEMKNNNVYVLGTSMLVCWDKITKWGYQQIDIQRNQNFRRQNYYNKALELSTRVQRKPGWVGFQIGHVNSVSNCRSLEDAVTSNSQLNLVPQSLWFNQGPMKKLEIFITKQAKQKDVKITHILSISMCDSSKSLMIPKKHYKVVLYELNSGEFELKCYKLIDSIRKIQKWLKISLRDVEWLKISLQAIKC